MTNNKPKRLRDRCFQLFLFFLSRLYRNVMQLRLSLYSQGGLKPKRVGCQVISVGNLTTGGTGKTPVVEIFAKTLAANGRKVAILSRGYRSKPKSVWKQRFDYWRESFVRGERGREGGYNSREERLKREKLTQDAILPRVVSDGKRLLLDSEQAGDEPYMLASNLKDVRVVVDKDRVKAARYAIRHLEADMLLLDDGFQYMRLKPSVIILLIDSTSPFHNHHCLPRGMLREPIKNMSRADVIFLTKSSGSSKLRHLKRFIHRHNPRAEIIECTHDPKYLQVVHGKEQLPLEFLHGKKVAAVSGIAVPESFENFLEKYGAEIVYPKRFVDHHRYEQQEIIDFVNASIQAGADFIVTTEKDAVRFPSLDRCDLNLYFLRVEINILSGMESFDDCIARICGGSRKIN